MDNQPLSPTHDDKTSIVEDCPVCKRVVWTGTNCHHGRVVIDTPKRMDETPPLPDDDDEPEEPAKKKKK